MTDPRFEAIANDPKYRALVRSRAIVAWGLSAAVLVIYFGFILLIAYAPKFLGTPINGGVTTIGIPIGVFVIVSAFVLTGAYVRIANAKFDRITTEIVKGSQPQ
jgi:uncharacterized membrane protein (DUF485 family)